MRRNQTVVAVLAALALCAACGIKGPPRPPLDEPAPHEVPAASVGASTSPAPPPGATAPDAGRCRESPR